MASTSPHLPSVCLEAMIKRLPLVDLIRTVGLVCNSWHKSRRTALKRRQRLVIVYHKKLLEWAFDGFELSYQTNLLGHVHREDGSPWFTLESADSVKFDSVVVPKGRLTISCAASFRIMSNIGQLVLMLGNVSNSTIARMTRLIGHSTKLVSLTISFQIRKTTTNEDQLGQTVSNLFVCLNRLHSLKHFTLHFSINGYDDVKLPIRPDLSLLTRLTTLNLRVYGIQHCFDWTSTALSEHGTNISSIRLGRCHSLAKFLQMDHQQDGKFTALSTRVGLESDDDLDQSEDLRRFCGRFSSLTSLILVVDLVEIPIVARCLSQLTQLVLLDLQFLDEGLTFEEEQDQQPIAQIPSVRVLAITVYTNCHRDIATVRIPEMLPNLQVLRLEHRLTECPDCEITPQWCKSFVDMKNPDSEIARRAAQCAQLTRQPFRACANLHTFLYVDNFSTTENAVLIPVNNL